MNANPSTFYEPQDRVLFDETTAEILTGATTYHSLDKNKQEELKKEFSDRVLDYFDSIDVAPTLDNLLLYQNDLRKEISFQIEDEINLENEEFLGLGKNAKAKREAKKSTSNSDTWGTGGDWNTKIPKAGTGNYKNANASNGTKTNRNIPSAGTGDYKNANASNGTQGIKRPDRWGSVISTITNNAAPLLGTIQAIKQGSQDQQTEQAQGFFPNPEPKKPKVLGLEPIVGIAIIILILAVFGFLVWQISQSNSK